MDASLPPTTFRCVKFGPNQNLLMELLLIPTCFFLVEFGARAIVGALIVISGRALELRGPCGKSKSTVERALDPTYVFLERQRTNRRCDGR